MSALLIEALVPVFTYAGSVGMFMAIVAKGINIIIKAATRGEIVV